MYSSAADAFLTADIIAISRFDEFSLIDFLKHAASSLLRLQMPQVSIPKMASKQYYSADDDWSRASASCATHHTELIYIENDAMIFYAGARYIDIISAYYAMSREGAFLKHNTRRHKLRARRVDDSLFIAWRASMTPPPDAPLTMRRHTWPRPLRALPIFRRPKKRE